MGDTGEGPSIGPGKGTNLKSRNHYKSERLKSRKDRYVSCDMKHFDGFLVECIKLRSKVVLAVAHLHLLEFLSSKPHLGIQYSGSAVLQCKYPYHNSLLLAGSCQNQDKKQLTVFEMIPRNPPAAAQVLAIALRNETTVSPAAYTRAASQGDPTRLRLALNKLVAGVAQMQ
jgi:hypothetical protein